MSKKYVKNMPRRQQKAVMSKLKGRTISIHVERGLVERVNGLNKNERVKIIDHDVEKGSPNYHYLDYKNRAYR